MHKAVQGAPAFPSSTAALSRRTRLVRVAASYLMVALGVAVLIRAQLGVAPYDVLNTGIADTVAIPVSVAFLISAAICYLLGALLGGKLGWASLIGTVVIAPLLEVSLRLVPEPDHLVIRAAMFVLGLVAVSAAVCLVISTEMGPGPTEVVMLGLVARGVSVVRARWMIDGLTFVIGLALGGEVGVGTVVFTVALGPMVAAGLRFLKYVPPGTLIVEPIA